VLKGACESIIDGGKGDLPIFGTPTMHFLRCPCLFFHLIGACDRARARL
jgi:hypothetical protein